MSFFGNFFRAKRSESVVLVDIGANAVAGAYARYSKNTLLELLYARRLPIEVQKNEPRERAMIRALEVLGDTLVREGVPALVRATGSHAVDAVLVSIDSPWQETRVSAEKIATEASFVFTKHLVADAIQKATPPTSGKIFLDTSVIATVLDGYETLDPYGKKVHTASVIILTTLVDQLVNDTVRSIFQNLYHTKRILLRSGSALRYLAMRGAFPHERDALILDATGPSASIALVQKGLLVAVSEAAVGGAEATAATNGGSATEFARGFSELAKSYPLPRTIFLLARDPDAAALQKALRAVNFGSLWLSDNPPKIVPLLANQLSGLVRQTATTPPDLSLLLMAIYYKYCDKKV